MDTFMEKTMSDKAFTFICDPKLGGCGFTGPKTSWRDIHRCNSHSGEVMLCPECDEDHMVWVKESSDK